jgi:Tfp pilus assembly protein PilO
MNISEKIEAIRRQPENIRLRYVWICVAVSMFVIILVWIFSISSMLAEEKKNSPQTPTDVQNLGQQLQDLKNQSPSLKDLSNQPLDAAPPANTSGFQYPVTTGDPNTPQSGTYSALPAANLQQ